jgi:hypothetical protein
MERATLLARAFRLYGTPCADDVEKQMLKASTVADHMVAGFA